MTSHIEMSLVVNGGWAATLAKILHFNFFILFFFCLQAYQSSGEQSLISGGHLSS